MGTVFLDTFHGANGTDLANHAPNLTQGGNWQVSGGNCALLGNQAQITGDGAIQVNDFIPLYRAAEITIQFGEVVDTDGGQLRIELDVGGKSRYFDFENGFGRMNGNDDWVIETFEDLAANSTVKLKQAIGIAEARIDGVAGSVQSAADSPDALFLGIITTGAGAGCDVRIRNVLCVAGAGYNS